MKLERIIGVRNNKTIYHDGELCVKVFDKTYSKSDILNEALNQARVEETGLSIPKIREVTMINGKWAIVSDYIKGKTLQRLMEENPEKTEAFLELFVDIQISVHMKNCSMLPRLTDKMSRKIHQTELDATTRYDLCSRLERMPHHHKLCHFDFNPSNVIIKDDGTPCIIDWAHASQGNASADVARTYLLFKLSGDDSMAERYLELFCERSGTDKKYVMKWMPLVAAAQYVSTNVKERELLHRWVNVVDYEL